MKRGRSRILALVMAFAVLFSFSFSSIPANAAKVKVSKVTAASSITGKKTVVVAKGKSVKLTATVKVKPNKKANKKVTYKSANKSVATVNNKGLVKGVKAGTTKITVTSAKNKKKKATVTVKVVGGAVKSVKLNKKKAKLNVGATLKLKATVKAAKGGNKAVGYKTSKKKVATVNAKGVVKGVAPGTATITATAADGSGKKATCKVTVSNPINMAGISVANNQTVTFSLDKPLALTPDLVSIKTKEFAAGQYKRNRMIVDMSTADNVNYTCVLSNDTRIAEGDYVQASVPSLTGPNKSAETQFVEQACSYVEEIISSPWTVGEYGKQTFSFGYGKGRGGSEYAITGLPAGLTYTTAKGYVEVSGTPTTAGNFDAVMTATDELGDTLNQTIHFLIGSPTVIAAAVEQGYRLIGTDAVTRNAYVTRTGGSGSYKYEIAADPQATGATVDGSGTVKMSVAVAGTYTVTVKVSDAANPAIAVNVNVVWNVKQGIVVGGAVKDAQGNPITDNISVEFTNKDRANKYFTYDEFWVNSQTGVYSAIVDAGVYDIQASYSPDNYYNDDYDSTSEAAKSTKYLYAQNIAASQTGYDIQLPDIYKVVLKASDTKDDIEKNWYYNNEYVGHINSDGVIYLKAGSYLLKTGTVSNSTDTKGDWFNGYTYTDSDIRYVANVAVVNTAVQAAVTKEAAGEPRTEKTPGAKDTTYTANIGSGPYSLDDSPYAYKFIPTEAGEYSIDSYDEDIVFYDGEGKSLGNDKVSLNAGTTYIIADGGNYNGYNFTITKVVEPTTTEDTPNASGDASGEATE